MLDELNRCVLFIILINFKPEAYVFLRYSNYALLKKLCNFPVNMSTSDHVVHKSIVSGVYAAKYSLSAY